MKTKIISTLKKELLIIELPRKSDVEIFPNSIEIYNQFTGQEETIKGSFTLLGKPDEIKEEEVKDLAESWESVAKDGTWIYENYLGGRIPKKKTALESFFSAIEKEITWVNPILNPSDIEDYHPTIDESIVAQNKFDKAQEKTFDKKRTLIFVKN